MFDYEYWGNRAFSAEDNMALEEFFLQRAQKNAVIRFFDFQKDSLILGYAQHTDAIKNPLGASVVRRLTGGSHVQVGQNTFVYSFAVPRSGEFSTFTDMRKYYAQHVADALENVGMENIEVDNKASTINSNGRVVASHAVIWGAKSALLHGLVIIDPYDAEKMTKIVVALQAMFGSNYNITLFIGERKPTGGRDAPRFNYMSTADRRDMHAVLRAFLAKNEAIGATLDKIADAPPTERAQ